MKLSLFHSSLNPNYNTYNSLNPIISGGTGELGVKGLGVIPHGSGTGRQPLESAHYVMTYWRLLLRHIHTWGSAMTQSQTDPFNTFPMRNSRPRDNKEAAHETLCHVSHKPKSLKISLKSHVTLYFNQSQHRKLSNNVRFHDTSSVSMYFQDPC